MKTTRYFTLIFLVLLSLACEENPVDPEPEPPSLDVAGEYIGAATILCQEYRYFSNPNRTDTIVYFSGTMQDTFIVEDVNPLDSLVKIHRLSYSRRTNRIGCSSQYDIGDPNGEYFLGNGKSWGYGYEYDKEWDSSILFNPDNTLTGYMLERDKFILTGVDSTGATYEYLRFFEYEISARR